MLKILSRCFRTARVSVLFSKQALRAATGGRAPCHVKDDGIVSSEVMRSWLDVPVNTVLVGQLLSLSVTVTGAPHPVNTRVLDCVSQYQIHLQFWRAF